MTDRVVSMRNRYLLVIPYCDHINRIYIVEHDLIECEQDSYGSDVGVPTLVRVDLFESTLTR